MSATTAATALSRGLVQCHHCALLVRAPQPPAGQAPGQAMDKHLRAACPRCGGGLHRRRPHSIGRAWALLLAAVLLYIPANVRPIMTVTTLGRGQPNTILSGVMELVAADMWPVALVVFVASVVVPVAKLSILSYLLLSVQRASPRRRRDRTRLYRLTELVGRWSMVDIYVVAILSALVKLGAVADIDAGPAGIPFAAVVILTMLAASSFDPRLIWDNGDPTHG